MGWLVDFWGRRDSHPDFDVHDIPGRILEGVLVQVVLTEDSNGTDSDYNQQDER